MSITMDKGLKPSESQIQIAAFQAIRLLRNSNPLYWHVAAIPNGFKAHTPAHAARMKAEGLSPGYPDIIVDVARHGYHGLKIETKKPGGKISDDQRAWRSRLLSAGYAHAYCYSTEDILRLIESYFALQPEQFFDVDLFRYGSERTRSGEIATGVYGPRDRS